VNVAIHPATAQEAVDDADIVVTATSSRAPVFQGGWLPAGVHVTAVGSYTPEMRELDDETLRGARIVVDERRAALAEAGELRGRRDDEVIELGEILSGRALGRTDDQAELLAHHYLEAVCARDDMHEHGFRSPDGRPRLHHLRRLLGANHLVLA